MPIGPQLPATAEKRKRTDEGDGSDSDDSVGPLPPNADENDNVTKKPRTVGPSLPPQKSKQQNDPAPEDKSDEGDSSDDDVFGPALPTEAEADGTNTSTAAKGAQSALSSSSDTATQSKRDEWMTLAPTSGDWSQRVDPTKLKNRKFNTGKGGAASSAGGDAWHETPEQKQARLQREVLGIKAEKGPKPQVASAAVSQDDAETTRRMKEYSQQRGPSLYDAHTKSHKKEEDDDPSARAFDREKDIGGGLQLNSTQRREMMKKSSDFNSRFSSAKYL
ncbi:hypothetical protein PMZ80_007054 [Knufia obscura]|uniref:DUF3752 domain-containing protein n=2 Tax=Knufia TaxID=430999 RepID=A0AAN8EJU3_9EURO|nr:hypothetical protein PMZ80_007054 [Knufia obscura]KAK5953063.1 hypothetical protein OHC33_005631 [Knufia fluminis]